MTPLPPRLERFEKRLDTIIDEWAVDICIEQEIVIGESNRKDLVERLRGTILAAWNAALEAVRDSVPPHKTNNGSEYGYEKGHNACSTAVTDHIKSLEGEV